VTQGAAVFGSLPAHAFFGLAALAISVASVTVSSRAQTPTAEWRTFTASWNASGHRHVITTESGRPAAVIQLAGSVVLTAGSAGLSTAFHGEAIAFDDAAQVSAGRAVWTDSRGHRVFSVLKGEPMAKERRIFGTITGGTGPYAGITGDYQLTWQYVVETDDGALQGRGIDLNGRFRFGSGVRNE
jgi:hypothetical protein